MFRKKNREFHNSCQFNGETVEKFDTHDCPTIQDLVGPEADEEMCICSSFSFRHKTTLHIEEQRRSCLVTGQCSIWYCEFCVEEFIAIVIMYEIKSSNVSQFLDIHF